MHTIFADVIKFECSSTSLFLLQRLKGSMSGDARDFNNMETRAVIKFFFFPARQGAEGNSCHSDRNIRGTSLLLSHAGRRSSLSRYSDSLLAPDRPEIECRCGRGFFPHRSRPNWGPPSLLYRGLRVSFPGVKRPSLGVDHPPHLQKRLNKEQSCTSYSPFEPSWPAIGRNLPLNLATLPHPQPK